MKQELYRQGDILIERIDELPKGLKQKDSIIALGEITGHSHEIKDGIVYTDMNGMQYIQVQKKAELVHQEHGMIQLEKGNYRVQKQREYNPQANRMVMD